MTVHPYVINPNGVRPGDLLSYAPDAETQDELHRASKMQFNTIDINVTREVVEGIKSLGGESPATAYETPAPADHLTTTWALNNKSITEFKTYARSEWSQGFYVDLEALAGVGFDAKFVKGEALRGIKLAFDMMFTDAEESTTGISTEVSTRGNARVPGTYHYYTFHTYHLRESDSYRDELLDESSAGIGLVTPDFPSNPGERLLNQRLRDMIHEDSKPWKICYVVTDYFKPIWDGRLLHAANLGRVKRYECSTRSKPTWPSRLRRHFRKAACTKP